MLIIFNIKTTRRYTYSMLPLNEQFQIIISHTEIMNKIPAALEVPDSLPSHIHKSGSNSSLTLELACSYCQVVIVTIKSSNIKRVTVQFIMQH